MLRAALLLLLTAAVSGIQTQQLDGGGYLQWSFDANGANYPFDSPYPPAIARGNSPGEDRIVTLSKGDNAWNISGLDIVTGEARWTNTFPYTADNDIPLGLTTADRDHNVDNTLNIVLLQHQQTVYALDGTAGTILWDWPIPENVTIAGFAGWNEYLYILVRQILPPNTDSWISPNSQILALSSANGTDLWSFNTTTLLPTSISLQVQYALDSLAAAPGLALFGHGNKLAAINATTGLKQWDTNVNIAGGAGQGQSANITDMQFLLSTDTTKPPFLLTTSNNWSFQRFIMFALNTTNSTAPPAVIWRTKEPETAMEDLTYTRPIPDIELDRFYYWSNKTDWTVGTSPTWATYIVGKKLSDGVEVWSKQLNPLGVPASFGGRVYVVTDKGLMAMQGGVGTIDWQVAQAPLAQGEVNGQIVQFTYHTTATFGNYTGELVAARCLDNLAPSLCMYSAFSPMPSAERMTLSVSTAIVVSVVSSLLVLL